MPSNTFYVKQRHLDYLHAKADELETVENPSQALQYVLDDYMGASDV